MAGFVPDKEDNNVEKGEKLFSKALFLNVINFKHLDATPKLQPN